MKLLIKNMNNICSKILVRYELEKLGLHIISIEFGEVEIIEDLNTDILLKIDNTLNILGLELIQSDNKNHSMVREIKNLIRESLKNGHFESNDLNFCELISKKLNKNYFLGILRINQT